jgi:hypothetical protein
MTSSHDGRSPACSLVTDAEVGVPLDEIQRLLPCPASDPPCEDWSVVVGRRRNMLLRGSRNATNGWIRAANMLLIEPIHRLKCEEGLDLQLECATLVLGNVDAMDRQQQGRFQTWLGNLPLGQTQMISFTTIPLRLQVQAGAFLDVLYYRLNTLITNSPWRKGHAHGYSQEGACHR